MIIGGGPNGLVCAAFGFGEVNGKKGAWGYAIGGMGAITQTIAASPLTAIRERMHRRRFP